MTKLFDIYMSLLIALMILAWAVLSALLLIGGRIELKILVLVILPLQIALSKMTAETIFSDFKRGFE